MTRPHRANVLFRLLPALLSLSSAACEDTAAVTGPARDALFTGPDACGVTLPTGPGLEVSVLGDPATAYDGPAVVEKSVGDSLVLFFPGETSGSLPRHATIFGAVSSPVFTLGASVWLTVEARQASTSFARTVPGFAVRAKKDGRLLFATSYGDGGPLPSTLGAGTPCAVKFTNECGRGTLTHQSLVVTGDSPVEIPDGQTRILALGGFDYSVSVQASTSESSNNGRCADYAGGTYAWRKVEIKARDLEALAARLDVGPAPACAPGNVAVKGSSFLTYNVTDGTPYVGPVVYTGRGSDSGDDECFLFDAPALPAQIAQAPVVQICQTRGLVKEPAIGQTLWASVRPIGGGSLRVSEHGALLLATAWGNGDYAAAAADLSKELGVGVEARQHCAYATVPGPLGPTYFLSKLLFATTTPTTLGSDDHAVLTIDGHDFDAWLSSGSAAVTVAAR